VQNILENDPKADVYIVVWEGGKELIDKFQALKDGDKCPNFKVMDREAICQQLGVTKPNSNRDEVPGLTEVCLGLSRSNPFAHLILDEMPCVGNFTKLDRHNIALTVALQPASLSTEESSLPVTEPRLAQTWKK